MDIERDCPDCGELRTFYEAASMELHLGTKLKYRCPECDYAFVRVDGAVDTGDA